MHKVIAGIQHFQKEVFPKNRGLYQKLALGQRPETLIVACSDSRISLDLITQSPPGEMFVCRNAGNIVPPYGRADASTASIEYALSSLPIRDVIVLGHSDCGAMKGLLHPEALSQMPQVRDWLLHAGGALHAMENGGVVPAQPLDELTKLNIRLQVQHLQTYPAVFAKASQGTLRLHGWFYRIDSGEIEAFDANTGVWAPLTDAAMPMTQTAAASQEALHA